MTFPAVAALSFTNPESPRYYEYSWLVMSSFSENKSSADVNYLGLDSPQITAVLLSFQIDGDTNRVRSVFREEAA